MPIFIHQRANATPVNAAQWFPGQALAGVADEAPGHPGGGGLLPVPPHAFLTTPKGRFTIFAGDWVITEAGGEMHTCHNQLFQQTYTTVKEDAISPATGVGAASVAA